MSKLKVNELDTRSGTTITVASGKTLAGTDIIGAAQLATDSVTADAIAANAVDTSEIAANAVTLAEMAGLARGKLIVGDASGDPSALATGSAGQFLTTDGTDTSWGAVVAGTSWQAVKTAAFTAVSGNGYPINTTSAAITVTLPASASVGDWMEFVDYAGTWNTNTVTLDPQSLNLNGVSNDLDLSFQRQGIKIVYVDATQGWVAATGVNETNPAMSSSYSVDFLCIAGGGGGSDGAGGGGGAGGYRNSFSSESSGGGGSSEAALTLALGSVYTITVGAGGAETAVGANSVISGSDITDITSNGGGKGGEGDGPGSGGSAAPGPGGSGGGGGKNRSHTGGVGTANQGYDGGDTGSSGTGAGGGGGASAVGQDATSANETAGGGGDGLASAITGSSVTRGGGGGGGQNSGNANPGGGSGGGGDGAPAATGNGSAGTVNTGGGGGGAGYSGGTGGAGGSGVVILRMPTSNYSGTTTGSPTVTTDGSDKVLVFNASGSYTG